MIEVAISAFGFNESTWRLQPWRYYYEIANYINQLNDYSAYVLSLENNNSDLGWDDVHEVSVFRANTSLLGKISGKNINRIVAARDPDVLLWPVDQFTITYTRFLEMNNIKKIGVYPGLWYTIDDFHTLSVSEIIRNREHMLSRVLMASAPDFITGYPFFREYFDSVITLSDRTKEEIVTRTGMDKNSVHRIMPGVDTSDFEDPTEATIQSVIELRDHDREKMNLLYMGSPLTIRGIDTLLYSIHLLDTSEVELTILSRRHTNTDTGEEHYVDHEKRIRQMCVELGIQDWVNIVPGFLSREEIRAHIFLSDVVCLPFKTLQADMPLSILEVLAQGRIPIATSVGGIPDLIDHGEHGLLVEPGDPKELAGSIKLLNSNPEIVEKFSKNAREYALSVHPTWKDVGKQVHEVIQEC